MKGAPLSAKGQLYPPGAFPFLLSRSRWPIDFILLRQSPKNGFSSLKQAIDFSTSSSPVLNGFKAFSSKAAKEIFTRVSILRWGFDMEVLTIALKRGFKIKEVGVSWTEYGGSHVPMKAYVESLFDLFKIKLKAITGAYNK